MYEQIATPNLDPYITQINDAGQTYTLLDWYEYCLAYVEQAFGFKYVTNTAWNAWLNSDKHYNEPPAGVYVPIWFSGYYGMGHGSIYYRHPITGQVTIWSSPLSHKPFTDTWSSIGEVERNYGVAYAGWTTDICGHEVIRYAEAAVPVAENVRITQAKCYARVAPLFSAEVFQTIDGGEPITLKGYVTNGAAVDGDTTWFVTAVSSVYMSAQVFTDSGTHGLQDLTPSVTPPVQTVPDVPVLTATPNPVDSPSYHIIVNKKHSLAASYAPTDLVSVGGGQQLQKDAADMFRAMQNDSPADVPINPASGYRSYAQQEGVYTSYDPATRDTFSARAGYSEHQTGLAIDISPIDTAFESTKTFAWLLANAHNYGFILRYPKGYESVTGYTYEPWHWRYIGTDAAKMYGVVNTLEAFYGVEGGGYENSVPAPSIDSPLDIENNKLLKLILSMVTPIFNYFKGQYKTFSKYIKK